MKSKLARLLLVIALVAIGVGLGQHPAQAQTVLHLPNPIGAGDFTTADPALVTDYASAQITSETHYALVRGKEDNLNDIQPGMASKWEVSADGLTITFTIRTGIPWVKWDGSAVVEAKDDAGNVMNVTAKDFEYGLKRTLDPATASEYAYVFTSIIKGAAEFNGSKETGDALTALRDAVGVKATDDQTLVVTLTQPASYAINILTLTNAAAQPQAAIEKSGATWFEPGTSLSYGPYVISEWKHDTSLTLTKNPFWPGIENSPKPTIDQVVFTMLDEAATFNNYQAGTIDVAKVPLADLDRIRADEAYKTELAEAPVLNSAYYGFTVTKPPFDDVRVRLAFSQAIDRQAIVDNVTKSGIAARWFSRPGIAAAPTLEKYPDLGISYDPDKAKASLDEYLKEKGITVDQLPPITLLLYANDTVSKVAEVVQQMWQETLGVNVQIVSQEFRTYLQTIQNDPPGVYALGWTADYADANNFLREVFRSNSGNNFTHWKNEAYDKLVDDAAAETDIDKRTELYAQAEDILIAKDAVIAPMYWGTRIFVTKPNIVRTVSQINGDERLEKWSIK
ncbi:MAG: peptide ABC transporter substrate-binding protein [Anaerolineae bacterium]|nr:peptide ABC transporter substrate-binding protein [Anaerolineae bacterium]